MMPPLGPDQAVTQKEMSFQGGCIPLIVPHSSMGLTQ